jgi:hypothetical protein
MSNKKEELTSLYKEDGKEMKVNKTSLEYALSLGWSKTKPKAK